MDGPCADAANLGEAVDDFLVGHATDPRQSGDSAVEGLGGEVAKGFGFTGREAHGAKQVVGCLKQELGGGVDFAKGSEQSFEDGGGGSSVELLINDGFEERLEGRVLALEFEGEGAGVLDEVAKFGIGCGEGLAGESGIVTNVAAAIDHEKQGTGNSG